MMKQYLDFKKQYPDKILLFRMGDFFETFGEDAKVSSKVLNITLTKRNKKSDTELLAGFPHKAIDQYLPKFIESGYCVVVVDQLEDPKFAKGIVKRGVVRVVTPGTLDGDEASAIKDSYLAAFHFVNKEIYVALCDISTGKFLLITVGNSKDSINNILSAYDPTEILLLEGHVEEAFSDVPVQFVNKELRNVDYSSALVKEFYGLKNIESLDIRNGSDEVVPIAMVLKYIEDTQLMEPKHIQKPRRESLNSTMVLDRATIRNLEIIKNAYSGSMENSLFYVLNHTNTRMGTRLLYSWLLNPLINKKGIDARLDIVEKLFMNDDALDSIRSSLENINDIERIVGKIGLLRANARDFSALKSSLESSLAILDKLEDSLGIKYDDVDIDLLADFSRNIAEVISDDPPTTLFDGGIIRSGYDAKIDELRNISTNSKDWIKEFEEEEKRKTGISSLKVGFNNVFGYYIDVTKTHQEKVPDRYIRKQTLVNSERYITEELKEKESIILNAQENLGNLEYKLFVSFRESFIPHLDVLIRIANIIAEVDVLADFAYVAKQNKYVKPTIYDIGENKGIIEIEKGRHPVVEALLDEEFISNDTFLSFGNSNMAILTGPNMSGKSTYIRQVATIVLMAQIGCYVPADKADISITDRIFTRVGAADDLVRGRSTFMVEMDESANIVNNATKYSLIVLDEVGRGTSTYDGVSIAWALAEYIVNDLKSRTLFATHYHELLKLAEKNPAHVKNYSVLVDEDVENGKVIFLRKIVEGGTDRSYGIYVAKMAGLPDKLIRRANQILEGFEQKNMFSSKSSVREVVFSASDEQVSNENCVIDNGFQYPLFTAKESEVEKEIQKIDVNNLTPLEALNKIVNWKKKI